MDKIDRYDIGSIGPLEKIVKGSLEGEHNLDASLALLKLYQFFPDKLNKELIELILLSALAGKMINTSCNET